MEDIGRFHWNNNSRTLHIWLNWYWATDYVRDSTETTLYWRWVGAIIWAISASIPSLASASGEVSSQLGLTILWDRSMKTGPQRGTGSNSIQSWNEQDLLQIWPILQTCLQVELMACFERSSPNKFLEIVFSVEQGDIDCAACSHTVCLFALAQSPNLFFFVSPFSWLQLLSKYILMIIERYVLLLFSFWRR